MIILFFFFTCFVFSSVDLVVFSYDRPLQLFAFLESTNQFVSGLGEISIIYRYSDENYEKAYQKVFDYFEFKYYQLILNLFKLDIFIK